MSTPFHTDDEPTSSLQRLKLNDEQRLKELNTRSLTDFIDAEKTIFQPTTSEVDMIKSLVMSTNENIMDKSSLFRSLIEHTEPTVNAQQLTKHFSLSEQEQKTSKNTQIDEHLLRPFSECVEQYYRILYRVCECTEELKQELRQVKSERDQMSEDLINAENAYTDVKKRNEKLKLIINEHKTNTETLKRFSEESVRYTEEQKQKYAVLKQHAQEKLNEANSEIERSKRTQASEMEGVQTQLRYAQLRVQSLEQEIKSIKLELEQKKKENIELTNICDELLATNKR
jgi:predicted S18 family serine protease